MFLDRTWRRDSGTPAQTTRLEARKATTTTLETTTMSSSSAPSSSAASGPVIAASSALSSSNGNETRNSTIVGIVLAVAFTLALAIAFRLHYSWRRRAARRRNNTLIQPSFYTDAAAPGRASVVPRTEFLVPPPIRPPEWDARSAAASSTAATFDSPISASDPHRDHGQGYGVRSLDEKLRDIFYPTEAPYPYPHASASLVPSFSSPASMHVSTPPISPPPPAVQTKLPSFVREPSLSGSPQAWMDPPPSPLYPLRPTFAVSQSSAESRLSPGTPVYGIDGRLPSYSRH